MCVCSNFVNAYAVLHSRRFTSLPFFHCVHGDSFYRLPPCLHALSRHAHARLERLIIARFPDGGSVAIRWEYAFSVTPLWTIVTTIIGHVRRCVIFYVMSLRGPIWCPGRGVYTYVTKVADALVRVLKQ